MIDAIASLILVFVGTMIYCITFQQRGNVFMIPVIALILTYAFSSLHSAPQQKQDKISYFLR